MSEEVGADVESICGKCGDTWHVVVAKADEQIAKVQCKQCGGYHRHKPPGGASAAKPRKKKSTSSATAAAKAKAASEIESDEPLVEPDMDKPVRTYNLRDSYEPGERIEHPKFGTGVVESAPEAGKMQVFFDGKRRILAQGKGEDRLQPPKNSFNSDPGHRVH